MSTATPKAEPAVFTSPVTSTHTEAPSLSPTTSSRSQNSPSMPSSSSSHPQAAHSLSPSESNERQIAEARAFLAASMNNIGSSLDRTLQERAKNLHDNSKVLEKQQKDVAKATEGLRKENEKLVKMANEGSKKVKELGNVQNWAEMLERDFLVLGEWVRLVDGGSESGSESGSSWTDSDGEEGAQLHGKEIEREQNEPWVVGGGNENGPDESQRNGKSLAMQLEGHHGKAHVDNDGDAQMQDAPQKAQHEADMTADGQAHGITSAAADLLADTNSSQVPAGQHIEGVLSSIAHGTDSVNCDHPNEGTPTQVSTPFHGTPIDDAMRDVAGASDKMDDIIAENAVSAKASEEVDGVMISGNFSELLVDQTLQKPDHLGK